MKKDKGAEHAKRIPAQIRVAVWNPKLSRRASRIGGSMTPPTPAALHTIP
jgi:hypothetical protein